MREEVLPDFLCATLVADPAFELFDANSAYFLDKSPGIAEKIVQLHQLRLEIIANLESLASQGSESIDLRALISPKSVLKKSVKPQTVWLKCCVNNVALFSKRLISLVYHFIFHNTGCTILYIPIKTPHTP